MGGKVQLQPCARSTKMACVYMHRKMKISDKVSERKVFNSPYFHMFDIVKLYHAARIQSVHMPQALLVMQSYYKPGEHVRTGSGENGAQREACEYIFLLCRRCDAHFFSARF